MCLKTNVSVRNWVRPKQWPSHLFCAKAWRRFCLTSWSKYCAHRYSVVCTFGPPSPSRMVLWLRHFLRDRPQQVLFKVLNQISWKDQLLMLLVKDWLSVLHCKDHPNSYKAKTSFLYSMSKTSCTSSMPETSWLSMSQRLAVCAPWQRPAGSTPWHKTGRRHYYTSGKYSGKGCLSVLH